MKRITSLFLLLCSAMLTFSQNTVENGGFENWLSGQYNYPDNYQYTSDADHASTYLMNSIPFNQTVSQTSDAYLGSSALKLTTVDVNSETTFGYALNAQPNDDNPMNWHGGIPYTEMPTGFSGYYKCDVQTGDSALILLSFSKAGVNIGFYVFKLGGTQSTYAPFNFNLSPALSVAPDSVLVGFASSDAFSQIAIAGSTVTVDNIAFTGVSSQPAELSGSFETWQSITVQSPNNWNIEGGDGYKGVKQSTDPHSGTYAIELTTYQEESNGSQKARAGRVSTGYYPNNCGGNCQQMGGYPYTLQNDALTFYYKYAPSGNDTANVSFKFKKDGIIFYQTGVDLFASSTYQKIESAFSLPQVPDSVIIDVQSSSWRDSALTYVGSKLIIDDIKFLSETTGVKPIKLGKIFAVSPNPAVSSIQIDGIVEKASVTITDMNAQTVLEQQVTKGQSISIDDFPAGMYVVRVTEKGTSGEEKLIKK